MAEAPYLPWQHTRDFLDRETVQNERIRKIETGVVPVRGLGGYGNTTPWFPLERELDWLAVVGSEPQWRIASDVVQVRGVVQGPAAWTAGLVAVLPSDVMPGWPLETWVMDTSDPPILRRVVVNTNGELSAFRDWAGGNDQLRLDSLRWPRG